MREKAPVRCQVGIRKALHRKPSVRGFTVQASLFSEVASEPGVMAWPGMSLADTRLLARWCPAQRWREPDLRLSCGTWEGASRYSPASVGRAGGSSSSVLSARGRGPSRGAQADRFVVAVRLPLDAGGARRK